MMLLRMLPAFLSPALALAAPWPSLPPLLEDASHATAGGGGYQAVAVAPDGERIAAGLTGGRVVLLDAKDGKPLRYLAPPLPASPWVLEFSPDGKLLAGLDHDGTLVLWSIDWSLDGAEGEAPPRNAQHLDGLPPQEDGWSHSFGAAMAWSPGGAHLVVGDWDGSYSLWTAAGELVGRWNAPGAPGDQLAWSADGERLLTAEGSVVRSRDAKTGDVLESGSGHRHIDAADPIVAFAVDPKERVVATGHADYRLRLWDAESGELELERRFPDPLFAEAGDEVAAIAFSPSGALLAISTRDGTHVFVFDLERRASVWESKYLGAHFFEVMQLAWSPDGSRLWFAFECGRGELFCIEPGRGAEVRVVAESQVPRFGGRLGAIRTNGRIGAVDFAGKRLW